MEAKLVTRPADIYTHHYFVMIRSWTFGFTVESSFVLCSNVEQVHNKGMNYGVVELCTSVTDLNCLI